MTDLSLNVDHRPVMAMLAQCPAYSATPIFENPEMAKEAGINTLWIKNEGERMGLGSFKALGGSYAILETLRTKACIKQIKMDINDPAFRKAAAEITFVCATAGNHGLSVAAAAKLFGAKSEVYIAESVPQSFAERLEQKGAKVVRQGAVYADSLDGALAASEQDGYQLIADTSWNEYLDIPRLI